MSVVNRLIHCCLQADTDTLAKIRENFILGYRLRHTQTCVIHAHLQFVEEKIFIEIAFPSIWLPPSASELRFVLREQSLRAIFVDNTLI